MTSFSRKFRDKNVKTIMDTATKTGIDAAKIVSLSVVQKTAETKGDLIGNKTVDKITSVSKTKSKEKEDEKKFTYHQKKTTITDDLRLFQAQHKNGIQKNYKPA